MSPTKVRSTAYSVACLVAGVLALALGRWLVGVLLVVVTVLHEATLNGWNPRPRPSSKIGWRNG